MAKYLKILIAILILSPIFVFAQEYNGDNPYVQSHLFTGNLDRVQTFGDGSGVQDLQNMVRPNPTVPLAWKCRKGVDEHNSTALGTETIESLHAYYNVDMDTNHFFAQYNDAIYEATNYPPTGGTTFGSSVYSISGSPGIVFSDQINGDWVAAAPGVSPFAWSGGSAYPDGFLIQRDVSENIYDDGYDYVRDDDDSTYIVAAQNSSATQCMYVGFRRRIDGITLNFVSGQVNAVAATTTIQARRSGAWATVSDISDGTDTAGATWAKDGTITWTRSTDDQAYVLPGTQFHLFWYKIYVSADITDNVQIARVRVADDCEAITNLWSGLYDSISGVLKSSAAGYVDYSSQVAESSDAVYAEVGGLTTTYALYVGCLNRAFGIHLKMVAGEENTDTAATMTVKYWNAVTKAWTTVGTITDGTLRATYSLAQSGTVQWDGSSFTEDTRTLGGILTPMYWYQLTWSANLPADTNIYHAGYCEKPDDFPEYDGVIEYNGRALWWPGSELKNAIDFSYGPVVGFEAQQGLPHVLNGPFAGSTGSRFGPGEVNAVARLYYYGIVSTKNPYRLYMLEGKIPGKWDELLISSNVGVVAPHTLLVIEDAIDLFSKNMGVHAGVFLAIDGVYVVDGKTLIKISGPISDYWDTTAGPYIEPAYAHLSYAWLDYKAKTVNIAVPMNLTGSGTQTTLNRVIVFNWSTLEWYDVHKYNAPVACGLSLVGSDNQRMAYTGDYNGKVYRTNVDDDDVGVIIEHWVKTSDFALIPGQDALNWYNQLRAVRVKAKTDTNGYIQVRAHPDGKTTGSSLHTDYTISLVKSGYDYIADMVPANEKGETFAFEFKSGVSDVGACMEIIGYTVEGYPIRRTPIQ